MNNTARNGLQRILSRKRNRDFFFTRCIVSQNFQMREAWQERLKAPIFEKIRMGEYFVELDKKFANEYRGSAIDVDIFANNVKSDGQAEHMEELLFKLRRTPHTIHTPDSTHHAAVRGMLDHGEINNLVKILDDRMNYGIFLDEFSAILTLDKLLENGENRAAARCASQLMLQEDESPLPAALGNLACWRYFESGREDPWYYPEEIVVDETPDEVIRVRVKVVPNNYEDDHFDLRDPDKILGKTLIHFNSDNSDVTSRSLLILGHHLYGNTTEVSRLLAEGKEVSETILSTLSNSDNEDVKAAAGSAKSVQVNLDEELLKRCVQLSDSTGQTLIEKQKETYTSWNKQRDAELQRQYELMQRAARVEAISQTKLDLEKEEQKLFFFDNLDRYEMEKEEKVVAWRKTLPSTNWNMKNFPMKAYYKKKNDASTGERKLARWEVRDKKKGPPK